MEYFDSLGAHLRVWMRHMQAVLGKCKPSADATYGDATPREHSIHLRFFNILCLSKGNFNTVETQPGSFLNGTFIPAKDNKRVVPRTISGKRRQDIASGFPSSIFLNRNMNRFIFPLVRSISRLYTCVNT